MIKEVVLRDFPSWDSEKQLKEYQAYKALGDYSPFSEEDYKLMEVIMNNHNAEIEVECENGICKLIETKDELATEDIETKDELATEDIETKDELATEDIETTSIGE